ncbi:unnamed protein product [Rhodiola kirilowii]
MPLFLSDEENQRCSNDTRLLVKKADAFIRDLSVKLETVKAQTEAARSTSFILTLFEGMKRLGG